MNIPIWTPGKPSHYGERHFRFSPKLGRRVATSSKLEYERSLLLEYDPDVESFCEQPVEAVAEINGRICRSRLDFGVINRAGGFRYEEVKYRADLAKPDARANRQLAIQRAWCLENGYEHRLVTDSEIWRIPTLINSLRTLLQEFTEQTYGLLQAASKHSAHVLLQVCRWPGMPLIELLNGCPTASPRGLYRLAVLDLIRTRKLDALLETQRFCPRSKVYPAGGAK